MLTRTIAPHVDGRRRETTVERVADPFVPVGRLAVPVDVVEASTPYPHVAELFRPDHVTSVLVCDRDDPTWVGLLTRERHQALSAGTLGYGHALLARRTIGEIVDRSPLAVPGGAPLAEVVRLAMRRPEARRFEDVIVHDAVWQVATVPTLVRTLAEAALATLPR